jgi:hypothetical protein
MPKERSWSSTTVPDPLVAQQELAKKGTRSPQRTAKARCARASSRRTVLLDIQPRVGGIEVLQKPGRGAEIVVIMITAYGMVDRGGRHRPGLTT